MYTNANCLSNKYSELRGRLEAIKPDIVGITEVWDRENFMIQGYHAPVHKHRANRAGRGVLLLFRDHLEVLECTELNNSEFEDSVWYMVKISQSVNLPVGVCYHSPGSIHVKNLLLNEVMCAAHLQGNLALVMGDFNYGQIC